MFSLSRQIVITGILLIATILFFGYSNTDISLQNYFYDFQTKVWMLDKNVEPYHTLFYTGAKKVLIAFAVVVLLATLFLRKNAWIKKNTKALIVVILSAIFVPVVTGGLKKATNMPCPNDLQYYDNIYPHTKVWEHYPSTFRQEKRIKCWPAGHASGGFALMSLFFLFRRKRAKYAALSVALVIGWSMGIYKMMLGDHFFSHTMITMLLAWLIILIVVKTVRLETTA